MAISENRRHRRCQRRREVLGVEDIATLMSYLPPAGWAEVATSVLRAEFRTSLYAMFTMMVMLVGAVSAAVKFQTTIARR